MLQMKSRSNGSETIMKYTVKLQLRPIGDTIGTAKPECTSALQLTNIKREDLSGDTVRTEIQYMLEEHYQAAVHLYSCEAVDANEFGPLLSVRCEIFGEEPTTRLVEIVAYDENGYYVPFPGQNGKDLLAEWIRWRNDCPEEEIYFADAMFAEKLGLPTLAALCSALDQITKASDRIDPKEAEAILRPVLSIGLGEARERLRMAYNDESLDIPGLPTIPSVLLEREVLLSLEERQKLAEHGLSSVEPRQFSAIDVLYRDAGNYKQFESYIVEGELSFSQLEPYLKDGAYFVGRDVQMEDLAFRFVTRDGMDLYEGDHPWQEIQTVTQTTAELASQAKEEGRFLGTAAELIERFKRASEANWPSCSQVAEEIKKHVGADRQETQDKSLRRRGFRVCAALLTEERNSLSKDDVDEWETVVAYTACDVELQVGRAKHICGDAYFIQVIGYETHDEVLQRNYDSGEEADAAALKWAEENLDAVMEAKRQEVGREDDQENERHGIRP
jgi:hypothetical protein